MRNLLFLFLILISCSGNNQPLIHPAGLTCEYLKNPLVVDVDHPRLSWINEPLAETRGIFQKAWQIRVAGSEEALLAGKPDLWNSGKVKSDECINIPYKGVSLKSRQDCFWQVRVWDNNGNVSDWSEPAFWSMGLLDTLEWKAFWIGAPWQGEEPIPDNQRPLTASRARQGQKPTDISEITNQPPAPLLRKIFMINKEVKSARAFVTGLGYFELYLNGEKVSDDVLVPNQTNYGKRPGLENNPIPVPDDFKEYKVFYLSYDIKDLLLKGENVIGAILGNGFYNAPINWTESYGTPRFLGQIFISYTDGSEDIIPSDLSWKISKSPILMDLIYDGEHYDARLEQSGWCAPGFDDSCWEVPAVKKAPFGKLRGHMANPDRVMESLAPVKIEKTGTNSYKVDFGQEISGWIHLFNINGSKGQKIDIKYLHRSPSGDNSYTLAGTGNESYSARFTWFVFREVEIFNWPGVLEAENIKAEAVYTQVEPAGNFNCSNELINSINRIWRRSQTDNMHGGIASDCPNRERSPYTGDGQVSCVTVMHNFDVRAFYNKWIHDIIGASNEKTGYVPNGAPWQPGCGGGVPWGAAISVMPWEFYLHYGDKEILSDSYDAMKGYIRYMLTWTDKDGIMFSQVLKKDGTPNKWFNLGEWSPAVALPPDDLVHTFYLWRCADITSKTARVLGKKEESEEYSKLAARTKIAFHKKFYDSSKGTYGPYGGNIFALVMGVPEEVKEKVISSLEADIKSNGGHLDTGIFGTQFFFEVLSENGLHKLAYEAFSKRTAPGYGYWVEQGSTTTWEGWKRPGSGNHPMFGGGLVWLYRKLAGMNIDPEIPGYKHIIFYPQPVDSITNASYSCTTQYGECSIDWNVESDKFYARIVVPVGCKATLIIPAKRWSSIFEGGSKLKRSKAIRFGKIKNDIAEIKVLSGEYRFESYI